MKTMKRFMLQVEAAFHMVDAYLARNRGEHTLAADCESRAYECERRIVLLELNHG